MELIKLICPLCNDTVDKLLYRFHYDSERMVIEKIKQEFPQWTENDGVCLRCVDFFHSEIVMGQRILPAIGPHFPIKTADDFIVIPTGLRINADPRYTGKGITICFIDSGFYPHPDLVENKNRIRKYVDIINMAEHSKALSFGEDLGDVPSLWHGTMTTVVCAGDGQLSNGLYKGIASDAELVLIKVQNAEGHITTENICKALQWVIKNHEKYSIRIINMSLGDDVTGSYRESEVDKLIEQLIEKGITIVAAVGNDENGEIKPPANSLNAIAVGGIDDHNRLDYDNIKEYHSSYGTTVDALMKPELVAHAIWIAAPILPGTKQQNEAAILYELFNASDAFLIEKLNKYIQQTELDNWLSSETDLSNIRTAIVQRIQQCKFISPHYMHVDGTSFAAPIVTAVIAQLLEANPELTPQIIREVLFSTSKRIASILPEKQGYGVIQPRKAILKVLKRELIMKPNQSPYINKEKNSIEFYIQNDCAEHISLAGNFNHWAQDVLLLEPAKNGLWKLEIPLLAEGKYLYKFFIDGKYWMEDVDNPYREADGFNGFNSLLFIQN
ncbi:MAG: S8 family serine peptidase [Ginsengibacter sp.]